MPDLPGVGNVSHKWLLIVGGTSAAVLGYAYYRHRKNASAAASSTPSAASALTGTGTSDPYPPDGTTGDPTDPNSTDPATGQTYGDEGAGYSSGYGGGYGYGSPSGGYYTGGASYGAQPPVPGSGGFVTNGQWAQQAEADLGGIGVDQTALSAALGKYLTGQPVDAAQQGLVDQAIAMEGYPPTAGPGGYPPAIHAAPTGSGGGTGGGGTGGSTGWYWHGLKHYFTLNGKQRSHPSGNVTINGKNYYWHADKGYFTLNGKFVNPPPSGPVT